MKNIKNIFKEEESIKILKNVASITNIEEYQKIYNYDQRKHKSRVKTKNYFIEEINQIELMSKTNKKVCRDLDYTEQLLILVSTITGIVSISPFASIHGIPVVITSSEVGLKNCV